MITIYCDGACVPNPGRGGWGFVLLENDKVIRQGHGSGGSKTTNQRMELTAALEGLRLVELGPVKVISDSLYLVNTMKGRFKISTNPDLWIELKREVHRLQHTVEWEWVRGHSGDTYNELADALAMLGVERKK